MDIDTPHYTPEHLPLSAMANLQRELIEGSGLDPGQWVEQYAQTVRELVEKDAELAALILANPHAAVPEVRRRLTSELPH